MEEEVLVTLVGGPPWGFQTATAQGHLVVAEVSGNDGGNKQGRVGECEASKRSLGG